MLRQTFCFAASPLRRRTGWQSGRNIAAPSKYINRQGKQLPDPARRASARCSSRPDRRGGRAAHRQLSARRNGRRAAQSRLRNAAEGRGARQRWSCRTRLSFERGRRGSNSAVAWSGRRRSRRRRAAVLLERLAQPASSIRTPTSSWSTSRPALAVHGGSGIEHGIIEAFRALLPDERNLELAHRLDRDTSGCLLLAKHRTALLELHAAFRDATVAKTYDVLVHGTWPRKLRTVRAHLEKYVTRSGERRVRVVPKESRRERNSPSWSRRPTRPG